MPTYKSLTSVKLEGYSKEKPNAELWYTAREVDCAWMNEAAAMAQRQARKVLRKIVGMGDDSRRRWGKDFSLRDLAEAGRGLGRMDEVDDKAGSFGVSQGQASGKLGVGIAAG
jgi:hypothetical protein